MKAKDLVAGINALPPGAEQVTYFKVELEKEVERLVKQRNLSLASGMPRLKNLLLDVEAWVNKVQELGKYPWYQRAMVVEVFNKQFPLK